MKEALSLMVVKDCVSGGWQNIDPKTCHTDQLATCRDVALDFSVDELYTMCVRGKDLFTDVEGNPTVSEYIESFGDLPINGAKNGHFIVQERTLTYSEWRGKVMLCDKEGANTTYHDDGTLPGIALEFDHPDLFCAERLAMISNQVVPMRVGNGRVIIDDGANLMRGGYEPIGILDFGSTIRKYRIVGSQVRFNGDSYTPGADFLLDLPDVDLSKGVPLLVLGGIPLFDLTGITPISEHVLRVYIQGISADTLLEKVASPDLDLSSMKQGDKLTLEGVKFLMDLPTSFICMIDGAPAGVQWKPVVRPSWPGTAYVNWKPEEAPLLFSEGRPCGYDRIGAFENTLLRFDIIGSVNASEPVECHYTISFLLHIE